LEVGDRARFDEGIGEELRVRQTVIFGEGVLRGRDHQRIAASVDVGGGQVRVVCVPKTLSELMT
jgi:hypothetical protein